MNCPACGHENRDEAKFCEECAASLGRSCASCGAPLRPAAKFCDECAHPADATAAAPPTRSPHAYTPKHLADKILQSKSALEGERKQVTVLFADVKGSMELAEQLDPEEWHGILDRFFQILSEGVHRFEGTVNQYTGDGIMALFGAPIAHEDHAQRACYAALHLLDALRAYGQQFRRERGLDFAVRIGLNTGEVVVGKIGDDLRMDYTAQGHTVGLASRMQERAEAGKAYLTEATAEQVRGYFELEDLEAFRVKGVDAPVQVFGLLGVGELRTRFDLARARGLSRFVGRDAEMQTVEAALERAREGSGQVLGVVAEAGTGKTRLCYQFVERCRTRGLRVLEGRGVAHGKNIAFLPILEILRDYFGIGDRDDETTARDKIAGRLLLLDEGFREVLPVLFEFLGVSDPQRPAPRLAPDARQRQLFAVLRRLLQTGTREQPSIAWIEDLHWIDGASETWVAEWVEAVAGTHGLLLVNFRPEYHADWMQKSHYQQLALAPLGPEAVRELLADLLGDDPSTAGLAETIHARTRGNPFFTEEVVQSLIESGQLQGERGRYRLVTPVEQLAVPASVQAVLAARIDRLPEREKQLLQTAAVIGKEFSEPVLREVADLAEVQLGDALAALKRAEFVYEQSLYPVAEYAFRHPLTQEVSLASQLGEQRRRSHAAVARAIQRIHAAKRDEQAALLAHHYEEAGELLEAARWHARAARRAGPNSPRESLRHWGRVKALAGEADDSDETLALGIEAREQLLNYGWRLGIPRDEADALFREGRALARRRGDRTAEAQMLVTYGLVLDQIGAPRDSLAPLEAGLALAEELQDPALSYGAHAGLWNAHCNLGNLVRALAHSDEGLKLAEADLHLGEGLWGFGGAWIYGFRALILLVMGSLEETSGLLRRCEEIAREFDEHEVLSWTEWTRSWVAHSRGNGPAALRHAGQALEHAERTGSTISLGGAWMNHGRALALGGAWQEARQSLARSIATYRASGTGLHHEPEVIAWLAEAYLELGDEARARASADEAVGLARGRELRPSECEALLSRARVLAHFDGVAARRAIEEDLARCGQLIEETGARLHEPRLQHAHAQLADLLGDTAARERHIREAHRLYTEMGATGHAQRLAQELGP